jgi:hypothetical protein
MNSNIYNIDTDIFIDNFTPSFMAGYDLSINAGDVEVTDTMEQDIFLIMKANPGNFYYYPKIGYGIDKKLNSNLNINEEKKLLTQQLKDDGFKNIKVNIITIEDLDKITDPELYAILQQNKVVYNVKGER